VTANALEGLAATWLRRADTRGQRKGNEITFGLVRGTSGSRVVRRDTRTAHVQVVNTTINHLNPPTDASALPLLLTTDEAAALLRLSPKTIRNWVCDWDATRRGPEPVKLGGRRVYRRADVFAFAGIEVAA
jgi:hypothetical protein